MQCSECKDDLKTSEERDMHLCLKCADEIAIRKEQNTERDCYSAGFDGLE